jgi:hypothetical protein
MIRSHHFWLSSFFFFWGSFSLLAQEVDILNVEVIQQGDSIALMYAASDSVSLIQDTTLTLSANVKVRANTWIYIVLSAPLDSNTIEVSITKNQHHQSNFSFQAHENELTQASGAVAKREFAYKFHLGTLKMKKGMRSMRVGIKNPQGVELAYTSKLF